MSTVRLGPKSQIVIPKEVRDIFGLNPGDSLLLLADRARGIALVDPLLYGDVIDRAMGATDASPTRNAPSPGEES